MTGDPALDAGIRKRGGGPTNSNRRRLLAGLGVALGLALWRASGVAQQAEKTRRIGLVGLSSASAVTPALQGLRSGLRELGYVEGRNLVIEYRWAEGNYRRLPALVDELIQAKVEVLVTHGTDGTRAAKLRTASIPIVLLGVSDPVATGLVDSLARPGGNITGPMFFTQELNTKRLEYLHQALPRAQKFAALLNADNTSHGPIFRAMEATAATLGLDLQRFEVRGPGDFEGAFNSMVSSRAAGVVFVDDAMLNANIAALGEHATKRRLPATGIPQLQAAGALIAYGVDSARMWRRSALYIEKLLKGAKPGDLPIERVADFELVISKKVAGNLGINLPQALLLRADRVIE